MAAAGKRQLAIHQRLATFRYRLRQFLRFSERAARAAGLTPQQHQLLLGVAGFTGRGWATISELADFLQERHNAVVGLVQRAEQKGLVRKRPGRPDRRVVRVELLQKGERRLLKLSRLHHAEVLKFRRGLMRGASPRAESANSPRRANRAATKRR
jgi:DNA-binding MarR family transcriptional regulator